MNKFLLTLLSLFIFIPFVANATILFPSGGGTGSSSPSGILFGNGISPLQTLNIGTNLTLTGNTLNASGGGGGTYPFTPSTSFGGSSATGTMIADSAGFSASSTSYFQGIQNYGWVVSTSTTVCPGAFGCQFASVQAARAAGYKSIHVKNGTYDLTTTGPILISQNNIQIDGEGPDTIFNCDSTTMPICVEGSNAATALSNININNLTIKNVGPTGQGTCIDLTQWGTAEFSSLDCTGNFNIGYIASSTHDTSYTVIRQPVINVAGAGGYGIYLGAHAINNTIEYPRINPNGDDRVTGLYLDGMNTYCIHCETEKYAGIGMEVGSDARAMELNVYQELNKTNVQIDKDAYAINITGFSGDASTSAQNLVDLGARGLHVSGNIGYKPKEYYSNINWGIGTDTPAAMVSIHDWPGSSSTLPFMIASSTVGATTTLFSIDNAGNIITVLPTGCIQSASGLLSSTGVACGSGSGGTYSFTPGLYNGNQISATSTGIRNTVALPAFGFIASSTFFTYASTSVITADTASTTALNVSGATTLQSLINGSNRLLFINSSGVVSGIGLPLSIANGGCGSFAPGASMLLSTNGTGGTCISTSTPTADHYLATSTTASIFPYASTTALTMVTGSTTNLIVSSAGGTGTRCAQFAADGTLSANASACGGSGFTSEFTPVPLFGAQAANSTSTLIGFTQGIYALASSTIGGGSGAGLYIEGGATTTKALSVATDQFRVSNSGAISKLSNVLVNITAGNFQMSSAGGDVLLQNNVSQVASGIKLQAASGINWDPASAIKFFSGANELARLTGAGYFGIATTAPMGQFAISDNTASSSTYPFLISSSTATATSTLFQVDNAGLASTTNLRISGITTASTQCMQVSNNGAVTGTGSACSGSFAFPFTTNAVTVFWNAITNSTTTQMHFSGSPISISASSTSQFDYSTTTALTTRQNTYLATDSGSVGIASTTPWGLFAINTAGLTIPAFNIGAASTTIFSINGMGAIRTAATSTATTTNNILDWANTPPLVEYRVGPSAQSINIIDATNTSQYGSHKMFTVINGPTTAGALTITGVEWVGGTVPTQTTTANAEDIYSCFVTMGSSTPAAPTYKVACAQSANFQ